MTHFIHWCATSFICHLLARVARLLFTPPPFMAARITHIVLLTLCCSHCAAHITHCAAHITHIVLLRSTRRLPNAQELPKHTEHLSILHKMRTVLCTRCSQVQNSLFKILCVFCFVYDTLTTNSANFSKY